MFGKRLSKFPRVYNASDFSLTANVSLSASMWNKVASVTVPAQQQVTFGGYDQTPYGLSGRVCYLRFDNTSGTQLHGKVRFALSNANETDIRIVAEERTEKLSGSQTSRTDAVLLPEFPMKAGEDSKLLVYFYPDSGADTLDYDGTNTKMLIPVTVYQ